MSTASIRVAVVMGSSSDWEVMKHAAEVLAAFAVEHECRVVSAHRMPDAMFDFAEQAAARGLRAIIAGAGGAAHLPGMLASKTLVPVYGVPVPSRYLRGEDSLLSIVQMPRGVPVATFAIGEAGAANAALHVIAQLALDDPRLREALRDFRKAQTESAAAATLPSVAATVPARPASASSLDLPTTDVGRMG
jgi:5-(carboxyamino)imidazole ribonucleotide mutase